MRELTHLSLFSGIGGLDLAAEWAGFKTVGQCEYADYPYAVLQKHWPNVPKWRDVKDVTKESIKTAFGGEITVCSGGFPCQPHSIAGKHLASNDERDLWSELRRVYCDSGAKWLVAENVGGLLSSEDGRFFGRVLRDLAEMGCNAWWYCFPASACGAPFKGERVALVAAPVSLGRLCVDKDLQGRADAEYMGRLGQWETRQNDILPYPSRIESTRGSKNQRNDDGIPGGLDELKAYGNAVNPYQFFPIFKVIAEVENETNL